MISFLNLRKKGLSCILSLTVMFLTNTLMAQGNHNHPFIENKGQILNQDYQVNNEVLYLYSGKGIKIQLRKTGYSYEMFRYENTPDSDLETSNITFLEALKKLRLHNYRVDIDFDGMNPNTTVMAEAEKKHTDYLNYYVCGYEALQVRSYNKITYKNVYNHTDIEFIIQENETNPLKYNIILHPGANINDVKFLIKGAQTLSIEKNAFSIQTPFGSLQEKIPFSFYTDSPNKNEEVNFILDKNTLSFKANYNNNKTLVIDPSTNLIWSTYYSGEYLDYCKSTRVDSQNNIYIAGYTSSTSNIATNNAFQSSQNGNLDGYLAKFDPNGLRLWATYFGGNSIEQILAMHITNDDFIYLAGDVTSTFGIITPGAHQMTYGGGADDMLLVKFDTTGQRIWATYFGGSEHEFAQAVCTDTEGNVIIAGHTTSTNNMATPGAFRTSYNFSEDGFIAKFTNNGVLLWGTYYNDSGEEVVHGVACDLAGNVYATGITTSIAGMATNGSHQPNLGGGVSSDGFLAKFSPNGSSLLWGTYYGGSGNDEVTAVRVGQNGLIYLVGNTSSNSNIATANTYQPLRASTEDGYLTCFNTAGIRQWGTYFGGNGTDYISDMVIDPTGNIVFCGQTISTNSIASVGAYQTTISSTNNYDAYFAKFSSTGDFKLGTYFGALNNDLGRGICVDYTGDVYLAGETTSTVGIATSLAHQTLALGSGDCFLAKFYMDGDVFLTEHKMTSALGLYPVPASDQMFISLKNESRTKGSVKILSSAGHTLFFENNADLTKPIDVRSLKPGVYLLQLQVNEKDYYSRFIKE